MSTCGSAPPPLSRSVFREVNDVIRDLVIRWEPDDPREFVCECGDHGCAAVVRLTVAEYDGIRRARGQYLVGPGHACAGDARCVEATLRYAVIEPLGAVTAVPAP